MTAERLVQLIHREGPIPFDRFVDVALYDPDGGFFARGRGAGRAGRDFVTSPETGSLFGMLVARALDRWWTDLGEPDPFVVVDAGAGTGRLAREVLRAEPACAPALRYVLVERSAALRAAQRELLRIEPADEALGPFAEGADEELRPVPSSGPMVAALEELPALEVTGVVVANELLDNLPFAIAQRSSAGWEEVLVGIGDDGATFTEVLVPLAESDAAAIDALTGELRVPVGRRVPIPRGIDEWLLQCANFLRRGYLVVVDYVDTIAGIVARGAHDWLRTYRAHERGGDPLDAPGTRDITSDVIAEQLTRSAHAAGFTLVEQWRQAEWLERLGVREIAAASRDEWDTRAQVGDLAAVMARSRVTEARALTDPEGLGAHSVLVFSRGIDPEKRARPSR